MEHAECPVCGGTSFSTYQVGRTAMLRCHDCHVTLTPRHISIENDERFYEHEYVMNPSSRASARQLHYSRYPEFIRLIAETRVYGPTSGRWLDVGCGTGAFLEECRHAGYEVEGVELSKSAASEARNAALKVTRTLEECDGSYDVVSMWHVLEHMQEPRVTLQSLRAMIRPNGVLCIRVPDFTSVWSRLLGDRWVWFQPRQHIVHFGPKNLQRLLHESGYTVLMMKTQRPNTMLVRSAYSLAGRVFNAYADTPRESVMRYIKRLLKDITAEEIFVIAKVTL